MPIVVLGSGIIGLSTAYFLSLPPNTLSSSSQPQPQPQPPPADWQPPEIHLVDPSPNLFRITASGLAGGFLAKDWFAPPVAPLGAFSFQLHRKLAQACGGKHKWGWCETEGWSLDRDREGEGEESEDEGFGELAEEPAEAANTAAEEGQAEVREDFNLDWLMQGSSRATLMNANQATSAADEPEEPGNHPKWIRAQPNAFQPITDRSSTAQVDPARLCEFLLSECLARGVKLHNPARATALIRDSPSEPSKLRIEYLDTKSTSSSSSSSSSPNSRPPSPFNPPRTLDIPVDTLILTAGAWTPRVYKTLFPSAPRVPRVNPLAGYSLLVKSPLWKPIHPSDPSDRVCHAIFTSDSDAGFSPEIFSRAGGEIWFGGLNAKHLPLPAVPCALALPVEKPVGRSGSPIERSRAYEGEKAIETLKGIARRLCRTSAASATSRSRQSSGSSTSSSGESPTASPKRGKLEVVRTSLCFRPVSPTGRPIIGQVKPSDLIPSTSSPSSSTLESSSLAIEGVKVFMGTAHGPWGISLSLGTGWVLGEMVRGLPISVDVKALAAWEAVAGSR